MKQLILGGVRSGKSSLAEQRAKDLESKGQQILFIATAQAHDEEMATRIKHHQASRPVHWQLIEEPLYLADAIAKQADKNACILVDCLTLWINNLLYQENQSLLDEQINQFKLVVEKFEAGNLILVSNETNSGIIPMDPLSRTFCDIAGRLHQDLAKYCEQVTLCVAGLPLEMKH